MATNKPRFSITLDYDTMNSVMEYKEKNNLSTQSKAIQRLVEIGLDTLVNEIGSLSSSHVSVSHDELALIDDYRDASDEIRDSAREMLHKSAERNRKVGTQTRSTAG